MLALNRSLDEFKESECDFITLELVNENLVGFAATIQQFLQFILLVLNRRAEPLDELDGVFEFLGSLRLGVIESLAFLGL